MRLSALADAVLSARALGMSRHSRKEKPSSDFHPSHVHHALEDTLLHQYPYFCSTLPSTHRQGQFYLTGLARPSDSTLNATGGTRAALIRRAVGAPLYSHSEQGRVVIPCQSSSRQTAMGSLVISRHRFSVRRSFLSLFRTRPDFLSSLPPAGEISSLSPPSA